jgi:hypothetical protein
VIFRRRPFPDTIERQLALFARDEAALLEEVAEAERAYERAERDEAEERYGDYVDLVETATEALADIRDHFAATLDEPTNERYRAAFNRAVAKRWRPFALELENR